MKLLLTLSCVFALASAGFFPRHGNVKELTSKNYEKKVSKKNQVSWVLYYHPKNTESKKLKQDWIDLGNELKGLANVYAVSCAVESAICTGVDAIPSIKVFTKGQSELYEGKRTVKAMEENCKDIKRFPKKGIIQQKYKNKGHDQWLEKHKDKPRAILFTSKKSLSPLWRSMALQFKGRMQFGWAKKGERKVGRRYQVKDFPTIIVIPPKDETATIDEDGDVDNDDEGDTNAVEYTGFMNGPAVKAWLEQYALEDPDADDEPLSIEQLDDASCMKAYCKDLEGICAIMITSVNPDQPDKRKLRRELDTFVQVKDIRHKKGDNLFNFVWMDGIAQMDFLDKALGLVPQDYPQVVVLVGRKLRYASFIGTFAPDSISQFLDEVKVGTIKTVDMGLKELPALAGDTERCKGMKMKKEKLSHERAEQEEEKNAMAGQIMVGHRGGTGAVDLNVTNFEEHVLNSGAPWFLLFIKAEEDMMLVEAFQAAAKKLKQMVKFGLVDVGAEDNREMASKRYGLTKFPSYQTLRHGRKDEETECEEYKGDRTAPDLEEHALSLLRRGDPLVPEVTVNILNNWFAAHPLLPHILVFSNKKRVPNMLKALAMEFAHHELMVGVSLDSDPEMAAQFKITEYPAFVHLQGTPDDMKIAGDGQASLGLRANLIPLKRPTYNKVVEVADQLAAMWAYQKKDVVDKYDKNVQGMQAEYAGKADDKNSKSSKKKKGKKKKAKKKKSHDEL